MYWYEDAKTREVLSPKMETKKELEEFNKEHRTHPKKTYFLTINGESHQVISCRSTFPGYRGNSRL